MTSPDQLRAAKALLDALKEQVAECFDTTCEMCTRHEALIADAERVLTNTESSREG
jgi:hypothetical protein